MKVLRNQTIYQCEYCGKRLLSKQGAKIHEEEYCYNSLSLQKEGYEIIKNCDHEWDLQWDYIPGEYVKEPSHDICKKCLADTRFTHSFTKLLPFEEISKRHLSYIARQARENKKYGHLDF